MKERKNGFYAIFLKRLFDVICSSLALIVFSWLYIILAILVRVKLGAPVFYTANRIGKNGKVFKLYKFRSMTDERDVNGVLLPDTVRLTKFGRFIRSTSLDELPEALNILKGDMSVIGPRPMPVSYLEYFTKEERHRYDVRPGLSGWAQVHGRNSISWDEKFELDLWYVNNISFLVDCKTIWQTIVKVVKRAVLGKEKKLRKTCTKNVQIGLKRLKVLYFLRKRLFYE